MGDESSSDVIYVGTDGSQTYVENRDRPIVKLFERLIGNDTKQNTVLTNAQLINILEKEFNVEVGNVNLLEIEVYINIIKKYLKDWPEWDKFEKDIMNLETQKNSENVKNIIEINYLALKNYLQTKLDVVKTLLPTYVCQLPQKEKENIENKTLTVEKIVMEVCATKSQLNNLILRHPKYNNYIFNWEEPQHEHYNKIPLKAILHWGGINIIAKLIKSPTERIIIKYENRHKTKYMLVNKKLPIQINKTENQTQWETRSKNKKMDISKDDILNLILDYTKRDNLSWNSVFQIMYEDLEVLTNDIPHNISLPIELRKNLSKYNYVRYMYKEVTESMAANGDNYDLQLEEMVTPSCYLQFDIHKGRNQSDYVKLECDICKIEFKGNDVKHLIELHFSMYHVIEPDWQCVNCNTKISARELAIMNWQHKCPLNNNILQALMK